jgi:hypothetical protein
MKKFFSPIIVLIIFLVLSVGCQSQSKNTISEDDIVAIGVAKTVSAKGPKDEIPTRIANTVVAIGQTYNSQQSVVVVTKVVTPKANNKVNPTADFRQASLGKVLGTWKVNRVNKSSRGIAWQDVGNKLTFNQDGTMLTEPQSGVKSSIKFRLDIKVILFVFEDGRKDYWDFAFTNNNNSLTLTKQGGAERIDLIRVN